MRTPVCAACSSSRGRSLTSRSAACQRCNTLRPLFGSKGGVRSRPRVRGVAPGARSLSRAP
eukprot:152544-Chlamydomonas_euryale.AAC.1